MDTKLTAAIAMVETNIEFETQYLEKLTEEFKKYVQDACSYQIVNFTASKLEAIKESAAKIEQYNAQLKVLQFVAKEEQ